MSVTRLNHMGVGVGGMTHVKIDSVGPQYRFSDVVKVVAAETASGALPLRTVKAHMKPDYEEASKVANDAEKLFKRSYDSMQAAVVNLQTMTKKASGDIRAAADSLSAGLARVEKQANFNNLERYVLLLERAAAAMAALAELEKSGKLEKIAGALK